MREKVITALPFKLVLRYQEDDEGKEFLDEVFLKYQNATIWHMEVMSEGHIWSAFYLQGFDDDMPVHFLNFFREKGEITAHFEEDV